MPTAIENTTEKEQKIASASAQKLSETTERFGKAKQEVIELRLDKSDKPLLIPLKALKLLELVIGNMAAGKSMILYSMDTSITSEQAAEILGISTPHLLNLLKKGSIPCEKEGSHYKILMKDVLGYDMGAKIQRRKYLDALTEEAQKLNLGY